MDPNFWHERWAKGQIGFHQHDYNAHMQEFIDQQLADLYGYTVLNSDDMTKPFPDLRFGTIEFCH